jgi:plasmid stabilization system protein ParE
VTSVRVLARPAANSDVEAAFHWHEAQELGLGDQFLDELRATYDRIAAGPSKYQRVGVEVRRALLRRFPYAVYFAMESDAVLVLAVLHAARDPAEWQRRA